MFRLGGDDDIFGQVDRMMNQMMGGLMGANGFPNPMQQHQQLMQQHQRHHQDPFGGLMMSPFGVFGGGAGGGGLMGLHNSMMLGGGGLNGMMSMMQQQASSNAPGTFVQQQFVSYRSDGVNPPEVVERTHMNRVGPGGVREERRTLRDSRSGVQQMSIGRHINDRGHVMERSRNRRTGEEEENQEFINIEEEEAEQFQNEWSTRMGAAAGASNGRHGNHRSLGPSSSHRAPPLAITGGGGGHEGHHVHHASHSAAASPRHHPHHSHHHRLSPPSPASTSSDTGGASRAAHKKSLRVKPIAMKKEKKSKKSSTHLPKE